MSKKLIKFLVHFSGFSYNVIACFFYRNMYYLINFDFVEIIGRNENSNKDHK